MVLCAGGRAAITVVLVSLFFLPLSTIDAPVSRAAEAGLVQDPIGDETLKAFVAAMIEVDLLIAVWTARIQNAPSRKEAAALNRQANLELRRVIEATQGITVPEYRRISAALRDDPALLERLRRLYTPTIVE